MYWTGDELRRPATAVGRRFFDSQEPAPVVAARRRFSSDNRYYITDWPIHECASLLKNLRRPRISLPNRRGSSQVQAGKNWTKQFSWVQFSFLLCIRLYFNSMCSIGPMAGQRACSHVSHAAGWELCNVGLSLFLKKKLSISKRNQLVKFPS